MSKPEEFSVRRACCVKELAAIIMPAAGKVSTADIPSNRLQLREYSSVFGPGFALPTWGPSYPSYASSSCCFTLIELLGNNCNSELITLSVILDGFH